MNGPSLIIMKWK